MNCAVIRSAARLLWMLWLVHGVQEGPWERRCRIVAGMEGWDLWFRPDPSAFPALVARTGCTAIFEKEGSDDPALPKLTVFWSENTESPEKACESLWREWASDPEGGKGMSPEEFDLRAAVACPP